MDRRGPIFCETTHGKCRDVCVCVSVCRVCLTKSGSSVMFVFDCATFPRRASQSVPTRVHIFDWGRSELNTEEGHARLLPSEQADRQKFWRLYRVALAKLLYQCCSLYVARFWKPVASITFRVWDKDAFTDDDFIGAADLSSVASGAGR